MSVGHALDDVEASADATMGADAARTIDAAEGLEADAAMEPEAEGSVGNALDVGALHAVGASPSALTKLKIGTIATVRSEEGIVHPPDLRRSFRALRRSGKVRW